MNNQTYIKTICLLGSDRQQLEELKLSEPLNEMMQQLEESEPAEKVLHALALDHYYRLAGNELPSVDKLVEINPIIEESEYASEEYYKILKQIFFIDKQRLQQSLLVLWIRKLIESNAIVHPMYLVKYLNALLDTTKHVKELAAPTLGKKGAWLIQQNLKYQELHSEALEDVWSFGKTKQRHLFLSRLLQSDPTKALQLVEESWPTETAREKRKHLQLFLEHTHPDHLDFIQRLYDEEFSFQQKETVTQRECRKIIAQILLLHSESSLHKTTISHLSNYIPKQNKGILSKVFKSQSEVIHIPETEDAFFNGEHMLENFGIDPQSTIASEYKTDQIYWFSELCGAIPFDVWTKLTGKKPKDVLQAFLKSDEYVITVNKRKVSGLKNALVKLASYQSNDALTVMCLDQEKDKEIARHLLTNLSASAWENYLSENLNLIDHSILNECPHGEEDMWGLTFSKAILTDTLSYRYDYTIGLTLSEYVHTDAINHLIKLNDDDAQKSDHYHYWKTHIFDPIYQTITIKNQIQNL